MLLNASRRLGFWTKTPRGTPRGTPLLLGILASLWIPGAGGASAPAASANARLTFLHTNDLHSHFKPDRGPLGLGGLARLKTLIERERRGNPDTTLLLDGGDFSEGNAYYTAGTGRATFEMMQALGYDFAAVGNHDWLNGPQSLLEAYRASGANLTLLGANFDASGFPGRDEWEQTVLPYSIRTVRIGGTTQRVAIIGLATFELIYDHYAAPVKILEPFTLLNRLSNKLRAEADFIVLVSHNSTGMNQKLAQAAPEVDLVIGAHDHALHLTPVKVSRSGRPDAWVVEAGSWGRFLGRVDVVLNAQGKLALDRYQVIQVDDRTSEDPAIAERVRRVEREIETTYRPIFQREIGESRFHIHRSGAESWMGNFATDAYRESAQADFSVDQINFIYGELPAGKLTEADAFNSNPGVFDPRTQTAWTLKTLDLSGRFIERLFGVIYSTKLLGSSLLLSLSGMELTIDPWLAYGAGESSRNFDPTRQPGNLAELLSKPIPEDAEAETLLRGIKIGGLPLDADRTYRMSFSGGVLEALQILKKILPFGFDLSSMKDTGIEAWSSIADRVREHSPLLPRSVERGNRIVTWQPDLAIRRESLRWSWSRIGASQVRVRLAATVKNQGVLRSRGAERIRVLYSPDPWDQTRGTQWEVAAVSDTDLPVLNRGEESTREFDVVLPMDRLPFPIKVVVETSPRELQTTNNEETLWLGYETDTQSSR